MDLHGHGLIGRSSVKEPLCQRGPECANHVTMLLSFDPFREDRCAGSLNLLVREVEDLHCFGAWGALCHLQVELDDVRPDHRQHRHGPDIGTDVVQSQCIGGWPLYVDAFKQSMWV